MTRTCNKYSGECTVTDIFCSKRYAHAQNPESEYGLCAVCDEGKKAFKKFKPEIPKKAARPNNNAKTRKKKGESPYSRHYIGSNKKENPPKVAMDCHSVRHNPNDLADSGSYSEIDNLSDPESGKVASPESLSGHTKQLLYDLELVLKAQVSLTFSLVREGRFSEALERIHLISKDTAERGIANLIDCPTQNIKVWITNGCCDRRKGCVYQNCQYYKGLQ